MGANKSHCGQVTFGNERRYWDEKSLNKTKGIAKEQDEIRWRSCEQMLRDIEIMATNFRQL